MFLERMQLQVFSERHVMSDHRSTVLNSKLVLTMLNEMSRKNIFMMIGNLNHYVLQNVILYVL